MFDPASMRRAVAVLLPPLLLVGLLASSAGAAGNVDLPRFPSISPDGSTIVFSWRGDLWKVGVEGGRAIRITSHPGDDLQSAWSGDGSKIAFTSDRTGYPNIHIMNPDGTDIRHLTDIDRPCTVTGFGTDEDGNEVVTFQSVLEGDVYREYRPYMVSTEGGDLRRIHDAFGSHPVINADGERVAFTRGGYYDAWERRHYRGPDAVQIWLYNRNNGSFRQLTTFNGLDGKPMWGGRRTIYFLSNREDRCVNLYRMRAGRGERSAEKLTDYTVHDIWEYDVTPDGSVAVLQMWDALYTLDLDDDDAEPVELTINASEDDRDNYELLTVDRRVSEAALSPDGKVMAVVAYGEVYVRNMDDDSPTRRVTDDHARESGIAWSPDGLKLYFTSDRSGRDAIYAATVAMTRSEVKEQFEEVTGIDADVVKEPKKPEKKAKKKPTAEDEKATLADDRISGVWEGTADVPEMGPVPFALSLRLHGDSSITGKLEAGPYSGPLTGTFDPGKNSISFVVESPDGVAISFDMRLEDGALVGNATAEDVVVAVRATRTGDYESEGEMGEPAAEPTKTPEKEEEEIPKELRPDRWQDAMTFTIEMVVEADHPARDPAPSPDGKSLAFRGTRGNIHLMDLETGAMRTLVEGWDAWTEWRWSPDSRYIAYAQNDLNFNSDIFIVPADGSSDPVNITRHPDSEMNPRWSADGRVFSFVSERINEEFDVWMVYLDKDLESLTREQLKAYHENAANAAKKRKPLEVERPKKDDEKAGDEADEDDDKADEGADEEEVDDEEDEAEAPALELEDAYLRLHRITSTPGNEVNLEMTPGGDRLIFRAGGESPGLYSVKWDRSGRTRLGGGSVQHVSLTGDKVILLSGRQAATVSPSGGSIKTIAINDRIRIDLEKQSEQKFLEAARTLGEQYYHPTMNGLDWPNVTESYLPLARAAHTADEFNYVANRFIGETNGSHLGVRARGEPAENRQNYGRLGTVHHRVDGGFEVTAVIPEGPASIGPMALQVGDVITAIDFEEFGPTDTVESMLKGRLGEETVVTVRRTNEEGEDLEFSVFITPTSYGAERQLQYKAWRLENARLVDEWSDGRLGYIHLQGMNQPSLDVFERDLFAAANGKDGLVLDVRNNGGGWTTDRVLGSIMVEEHAWTVPRGVDWSETGHYPQDRLFIQRYMMPMNLLCNEKSYSNAEIMAHAFKTLERGTLVGQQTHGSVISTGGFGLIDGTFVRLPFRGWFVAPDGVNMELNGAMPDLLVPQTPEAEERGEDEQLRAAVDDLLKRID